MTDRPVSASTYAKVSLVALSVALGSMLGMFFVGDDAVSGGFQAALDNQARGAYDPTLKRRAPRAVANNDMPAASEDFWLGHAARTNTVPVAWSEGLQIGDTVRVSSKGRTRVLRVEAVAPVAARLVGEHGQKSAAAPSLVVVTAREPGREDGLVMRLVVDGNANGPLGAKARIQDDHNL